MSGDDPTFQKDQKRPAGFQRKMVVRIVRSPDLTVVGKAFDLADKQVLGRRDSCTIKVDDSAMSREHLHLIPDPSSKSAIVEDRGTSNGTILNGGKIQQPTQVSNGDVLVAGDTIMVVDVQTQAPPKRRSAPADDLPELVGWSYATEELRNAVHNVAHATGPVLLLGATGTGKEVVARAIHRLRAAPGAPMVALNCANLSDTLARSELFGHKKGAYSGALTDHDGAFKRASGGTLFLDEVGELQREVQAMLLRTLVEHEIDPVGGSKAEPVDTRVIFATLKELNPGNFREDLLARMDRTIRLPPLADRRADVLLLFRHFLLEAKSPLAALPSSAELDEALLLYSWPENVREVRRLARQIAATAEELEALELELLPPELQAPINARYDEVGAPDVEDEDSPSSKKPSRAKLVSALANHRGNVTKVAQELGVFRTQVNRWLNAYGIDRLSFTGKDPPEES